MSVDFIALIRKYYADNPPLQDVLLTHSRSVANMALEVAQRHAELDADESFLFEAAMLHDIGIFKCNAPSIYCHGSEPYICHGFLGAELLRAECLPKHARVAERHTGTGITERAIREQNLPIPLHDYSPETIEEQIVCYADKFFSKTHLERVRTPQQVLTSLEKFGKESVDRMRYWLSLFG